MPKVIPIKKYKTVPRPRVVPAKPVIVFDDARSLHKVIPISATKVIHLKSLKALMLYRDTLYKINSQGEFKYRTSRSDAGMYSLNVWRLK
jgi:hypothetical protein